MGLVGSRYDKEAHVLVFILFEGLISFSGVGGQLLTIASVKMQVGIGNEGGITHFVIRFGRADRDFVGSTFCSK